jgi:predicted nucleic acid-binding protein
LVTYADSSFLVSLYVTDANSGGAKRFLEMNPIPVCLTHFSIGETQHAIRLLCFRKAIPPQTMTRGLVNFDRDQTEGFFEMVSLNTEALFQKASALSVRYTQEFGVRYPDMLHLASASLGRAKGFLTFDERQAKLARAIGLQVKP